jgi:hypothetical protein
MSEYLGFLIVSGVITPLVIVLVYISIFSRCKSLLLKNVFKDHEHLLHLILIAKVVFSCVGMYKIYTKDKDGGEIYGGM